jgi:hypothetical protein
MVDYIYFHRLVQVNINYLIFKEPVLLLDNLLQETRKEERLVTENFMSVQPRNPEKSHFAKQKWESVIYVQCLS